MDADNPGMTTFVSILVNLAELLLLTAPVVLLYWRFPQWMGWMADRLLDGHGGWLFPYMLYAWGAAVGLLWILFCVIAFIVWLASGCPAT